MSRLLLSDQVPAIGFGLILERQSLTSLLLRSTRTTWWPLGNLLAHLLHLLLRILQPRLHAFQITSHAIRLLFLLTGFRIGAINLFFQTFVLHLQKSRIVCTTSGLHRQSLADSFFAATHNLVDLHSLGLFPGAGQAKVEVARRTPKNGHPLRHVGVAGAAVPLFSGAQLSKDVAIPALQPLWDRPFSGLYLLLLLLNHFLLRRNCLSHCAAGQPHDAHFKSSKRIRGIRRLTDRTVRASIARHGSRVATGLLQIAAMEA
mmetsp:Transcript_23910/g.57993  ORF Transcript_23910/g.57993 Transcript_23910/m.57993 type:complete len:260 (+) Transcript_23910:1223-2002(+)